MSVKLRQKKLSGNKHRDIGTPSITPTNSSRSRIRVNRSGDSFHPGFDLQGNKERVES